MPHSVAADQEVSHFFGSFEARPQPAKRHCWTAATRVPSAVPPFQAKGGSEQKRSGRLTPGDILRRLLAVIAKVAAIGPLMMVVRLSVWASEQRYGGERIFRCGTLYLQSAPFKTAKKSFSSS